MEDSLAIIVGSFFGLGLFGLIFTGFMLTFRGTSPNQRRLIKPFAFAFAGFLFASISSLLVYLNDNSEALNCVIAFLFASIAWMAIGQIWRTKEMKQEVKQAE